VWYLDFERRGSLYASDVLDSTPLDESFPLLPGRRGRSSPNGWAKESTAENIKTPKFMASGSLYVWVRAGYSAAGTSGTTKEAEAALAAFAVLFFSRFTFAHRFT